MCHENCSEWSLLDHLDRAESENGRLKKAIEDYGNNPAGFDWAILEKIENQESINTDLLTACCNALGAYEALKITGLDKQLPGYDTCFKFLKDIISKAEREQVKEGESK